MKKKYQLDVKNRLKESELHYKYCKRAKNRDVIKQRNERHMFLKKYEQKKRANNPLKIMNKL